MVKLGTIFIRIALFCFATSTRYGATSTGKIDFLFFYKFIGFHYNIFDFHATYIKRISSSPPTHFYFLRSTIPTPFDWF